MSRVQPPAHVTVENAIDVGDRRVRVSTPDRVLWPESGFTKRQMIDYDLAIGPVLLPHVRERAVMLWRFPEGVDGPGWFQANCRGRPEWLPTHEVRGKRGEPLRYCVVDEPAALVWLANLGTIELHPFLWRIDRPTTEPTALVLDLDPGPPAGLREAARVAMVLRRELEEAGLEGFAKTSGGLGLHVFAPLAPGQTFAAAKAFARRLADRVAANAPDLVIERSSRAERAGRVYIDWIQNDANRQTVAAYSLRATPIPLVSTPVTWDEVDAAASGRVRLRFGPDEVLRRVDRFGDLFAPVLRGDGRLPDG